MSVVTIYHNPKCSKSRKALSILESKKLNIVIRDYLSEGLSTSEITQISQLLGLPVEKFIRKKEDIFMNINIDWSQEALAISALSQNPILLERPIVILEQRAIIARPAEEVEKLF